MPAMVDWAKLNCGHGRLDERWAWLAGLGWIVGMVVRLGLGGMAGMAGWWVLLNCLLNGGHEWLVGMVRWVSMVGWMAGLVGCVGLVEWLAWLAPLGLFWMASWRAWLNGWHGCFCRHGWIVGMVGCAGLVEWLTWLDCRLSCIVICLGLVEWWAWQYGRCGWLDWFCLASHGCHFVK